MEKELMLLRDEPEKYLAKLQEINQLKQDQNVQKELLEQIKAQGLALTQLTNMYSGMMTPAQLLEASPEFQDLTSAEKKVALANLQKQVPRDKVKQKVVIQQILSQPKQVVEKLKEGVKLETQLLESKKPRQIDTLLPLIFAPKTNATLAGSIPTKEIVMSSEVALMSR